jgi:hypothetical protein
MGVGKALREVDTDPDYVYASIHRYDVSAIRPSAATPVVSTIWPRFGACRESMGIKYSRYLHRRQA